jgi:hypothetical protein
MAESIRPASRWRSASFFFAAKPRAGGQELFDNDALARSRRPKNLEGKPAHKMKRNGRSGDRPMDIEEVVGSIPSGSTKKSPRAAAVSLLLNSYNFIRHRAFRARSAAPCAASRRRDRRRASPARVRGDAARAAPTDRPQRHTLLRHPSRDLTSAQSSQWLRRFVG